MDNTQRYSLQEARECILKALTKLNKVHNLNITLLDVSYMSHYEYFYALLQDRNSKHKFICTLAESLFTATGNTHLADIDAAAKIEGKNLDDETKTILRVAYAIWTAWKEKIRNADLN